MSLVKRQLLLCTLGIVVLGIAFCTTATANRLSIGEPRFRAVWSEMLFYRIADMVEIRCPITLEGSFHSRTLTKILGTLVGHITRASVATGSCVGGRMRWLTTRLPWHLKHDTFNGSLPNITSIVYRGVGAEFLLEYTIMGVPLSCLYVTSEPKSIFMAFKRDTVTRQLTRIEASLTDLTSSTGGSCRTIGIFGESSSLTRLGFGETITVTLI